MESQKLTNWIQAITGIAVIVGLAIVLYELQQTQELTRLQLSSDGYINGMDTSRSELSEDFAATRTKACFKPDELTHAEVFEMFSYHGLRLSSVDRLRIYSDLGQETVTWQQLYRESMRMMLSTTVGRAQYKYLRQLDLVTPEKIEIVETLIREGVPTCAEEMGAIATDAREGIELTDLL